MSGARVDVDIAIGGAGPAGQALALALADAGFRVELVDAADAAPVEPGPPDLRVFALAPATTALLATLGAWPPPLATRVCPYRHMLVWQDDPVRGLRFDAAELGWSRLGDIVEHGVLQHALAGPVGRSTGIRQRWCSRIVSVRSGADAVVIGLADGSELSARLLVGADGAASPVRTLAGLSVERVDYHQCGLVANVATALAHGATARQRFLATGPLALLPLADGGSSIVWSLPEHEAARLQALPVPAFERELAVATGGVLGAVTLTSARRLFPLARQLASRYHADRVVLVGDAAHVVHPLAGQGLNLGLLDVAALAEVLASAHARSLDPGSEPVLARYARWRQGDNALAARAFEVIDRLYRVDLPGAALARGLGQGLLQRLPALKRRLVLQASGLAGRVPLRCRPPGAAVLSGAGPGSR